MYSAEEFDNQKTRIMKYIVFKRRTEQEVRTKFSSSIEENMLEDLIEYLKEANYLNDSQYIEKSINNFKALKNLSIKELRYKLLAKGLDKNDIDNYIYEHKDELDEYEQKSAQNIFYKKEKDMEIQEIKQYLFKKGYKSENIEQLNI